MKTTQWKKRVRKTEGRRKMKERSLESRAKLAQVRCYLASDRYTKNKTEHNKRVFCRTHKKEIMAINALRIAGRLYL